MTDTRPGLLALLVAPDEAMRFYILAEIKQITIREGWRDYQVGRPVMLCCEKEPWCVMADIVEVRHCTLSGVTYKEMAADGFQTYEDLIEGMRHFYPDMNLDSPVTVIRWANVRGKMVDEFRMEIVAKARSQGPVSKEEALKAAERVAELDTQEGLGELIVERAPPVEDTAGE